MSSKVRELVDFDWKLLYTLSSDKNEGIKKPSVRLQLSLDSDGTKEHLYYEMNDQQLDDLLQKLLKIQQKQLWKFIERENTQSLRQNTDTMQQEVS